MGGRVTFFSLLSVGGSQFFSKIFLGRVIIFLKFLYPAAAGAGFHFLLILSLPLKNKCLEGRRKTIYMNLDVGYGILKERQTDRRILLFYCYV